MDIRKEKPADIKTIHSLTTAAFTPMAYSDGTEASIIDSLREAGELALSLVAVKNEIVVGHVAFSAVTIDGVTEGWFGLGPISVWPEQQHKGIGSALINEGFKYLRDAGASGCALIGDPGYYSRFGFVSDGSLHYNGVPDSHVQWISFTNQRPSGQLAFSAAFGD